jgi:hypothetical protein
VRNLTIYPPGKGYQVHIHEQLIYVPMLLYGYDESRPAGIHDRLELSSNTIATGSRVRI